MTKYLFAGSNNQVQSYDDDDNLVDSDLIVAAPYSVKIVGATNNVSVNSTAVSFTNASSTFTITPPTAAQITTGNYFLAANGTWVQLTVP